ncbi:sirohydrochlorin chelatase [Actinopolymorpha singaporensis]
MPTAEGLLLVAHGSRDDRAAPVAHEVAAAVARLRPGLATGAAFLELATPTPQEAVENLAAQGVTDLALVPFLLSDAYHAQEDLPAVADLARSRGWTVRLSRVLGPDPRLVEAMAARLAEARPSGEPPFDAVVLAAAGSSSRQANDTVAEVAADLGHLLGVPARWAFASAAAPTVEEAVGDLRARGADRVGVATYLLAPGFFADRIRAAAASGGAVAVTEPLGACPQVAAIVADRASLDDRQGRPDGGKPVTGN